MSHLSSCLRKRKDRPMSPEPIDDADVQKSGAGPPLEREDPPAPPGPPEADSTSDFASDDELGMILTSESGTEFRMGGEVPTGSTRLIPGKGRASVASGRPLAPV